MADWFLTLVDLVVTTFLIVLVTVYAVRYYWWRSPAGRTLVLGLVSALLVTTGGLFERFGHVEVHDYLVAFGYLGAAAALCAATRHVIGLRATTHEILRREDPPTDTEDVNHGWSH